jgi:hypothetical protein
LRLGDLTRGRYPPNGRGRCSSCRRCGYTSWRPGTTISSSSPLPARGPHARETKDRYGRRCAASTCMDPPSGVRALLPCFHSRTTPRHSPARAHRPRHSHSSLAARTFTGHETHAMDFPSDSCVYLGSSSRREGGGEKDWMCMLRAISALGYPVPCPRCSARWRGGPGAAGRCAPRLLSSLPYASDVSMCGRRGVTIDAYALRLECTLDFRSLSTRMARASSVATLSFTGLLHTSLPFVLGVGTCTETRTHHGFLVQRMRASSFVVV